jgi:hypothetical protein
MVVTAGATAVGGGDFIVVVDSEVVELLLVESVTIGSAKAEPATTIAIATKSFFILVIILGVKTYYKPQENNKKNQVFKKLTLYLDKI